MNKKIVEAVLEEVDAILSSPVTAKGVDEALLIQPETREEVRRMLLAYLSEAPEPQSLVHATRRR